MKKIKISRKAKFRLAQAASVVGYAVFVAIYGYFNYEEGGFDALNNLCNIADNDEKHNSVVLTNDETGKRHLLFDEETTKKLMKKADEIKNSED